jgi:hypothetical integral membrane protein (TIGR02206 family)
VRQFSSAHVAALAVLMGACGAAILVPRRHPGEWVWRAARVLAAVIAAGWAGEYIAEVIVGTWSLGYSLPLQLTDAVSMAAILALLTRRQSFIDLVYYWAFSAALQAALTPDLGPGQSFPSVFYFTYFTYHVGAIEAACLLVFGCRLYPRPDAMWRVYGLTLCWAALAGLGDVITGGNYMYLRAKPVHHSLLDVMGPWPLYIAAGAALGLLIFLALRALLDGVRRTDVGYHRS